MKNWFGLRIEFSCAHFYHQRKWNSAKNQEAFGKCDTPYGHGHDYILTAQFKVDQTSRDSALAALTALRNELDHQHLNFVIPEFEHQIPTTENITLFCLDRLQRKLGKTTELRLELWERPDLGSVLQNPSPPEASPTERR